MQASGLVVRFALDGQSGEKPPKNGKPRVVVVPTPALAAPADVPPRLDSPYLFHRGRSCTPIWPCGRW